MKTKDIGRTVAIISSLGLIGFGMWLTKSADPLWALILVAWWSAGTPKNSGTPNNSEE